MLAPCITVLSTSKNAAAVGSAGVARAVSTSAAAAAASPARAERCWRFSGLRLFSGVTRRRAVTAAAARCRRRGRRLCEIIAPHARDPRRVLARGRGGRRPARRAGRRRGRADAASPGPSSRTRSRRVATGLGAAGPGGRPAGADRDRQPDRVRDGLPRRAARAGRSPCRSTRAPTAGELARMIADSGCRIVVADAETIATRARRRRPGPRPPGPARPTSWTPTWCGARTTRGSYVVGAAPAEGEQSYDALRAAAAAPVPPLPDPEKLACLLYTSGTSGRPRAAMLTHRALLANIDQAAAGRAADDPRRRRGARRAAAVPRLRPQRRARQRAAPPRQAGARRRASTRRPRST